MARIRAGNLDRRVTIQISSLMPDSFGEPIKTWTTFKAVWARVLPQRGDESFVAEQRSSRAEVRLQIRYLAGVTPQMRVLYRGETYEIDDVSEADRNHDLILTCHVFEVQSGS